MAAGLCPDPLGSLSAPPECSPDPLAAIWGLLIREGVRRDGKKRKGWESRREGRKWKWRKGGRRAKGEKKGKER